MDNKRTGTYILAGRKRECMGKKVVLVAETYPEHLNVYWEALLEGMTERIQISAVFNPIGSIEIFNAFTSIGSITVDHANTHSPNGEGDGGDRNS